jgi:hypothetical protein
MRVYENCVWRPVTVSASSGLKYTEGLSPTLTYTTVRANGLKLESEYRTASPAWAYLRGMF